MRSWHKKTNAYLSRYRNGFCLCDNGTKVHITGGSLNEAIQEGVRQGYTEGYLRKSVVKDPLFERTNTKDNTPAIIYYDIVEGDTFHITLAPKGLVQKI